MTIESCAPAPAGTGLAAVRLDGARLALLWGGPALARECALPAKVTEHALAKVELFELQDDGAARAKLHAMFRIAVPGQTIALDGSASSAGLL